MTPELLDDPLPFPPDAAAPADDVAALAAAAVRATADGHARARAGDWRDAARALAESVAHRERLVHLEAAGPAVTVRGWLELAVAELALDRTDAARALLARARAAIAFADPGPETGALNVAVEEAWARVGDAGPAVDAPHPGIDAAWPLALADSVASAERAAAEAAAAARLAEAVAQHVETARTVPTLDAGALDDGAAAVAACMDASPIAASRDVDAPVSLDELAFLVAPAASATAGAAADDAPRAEPDTAPSAPTIALAAGGMPPALDGLLLLDADAPAVAAPAQAPAPWVPAVAADDDELEFLSPASAVADPIGAASDGLAGGAPLPAEAALAGAGKPRVHVVLPDFPEEAPKKGGLLSRLRGIVRR